jgi:arylsulfatase A-like enzyme
MDSRALIGASALVLAACNPAEGERIVLVTIDTWRADALAEMPRTSALAARGLRFEQAYSASPATQPTHASLLTGLHPWQHGLTKNGEVMPGSITTVAERLKAAGFATGAVVASFPLGRRFGYDQGFDHFEDDFELRYWRDWAGEPVEGGRFYSLGESITQEALQLLDELDGPRQFLWVHYFDPHDPYGDADPRAESPAMPIVTLLDAATKGHPSPRALVAQAHKLYRRDLLALDRSLERLLERLIEDRDFETHVIITADHGESFGERGLYGHGKHLTPEQVHVPLVILSPQRTSERRQDAAGSVDVAVTLLRLAGLGVDDLRGRDLIAPVPAATAALGMRRNSEGPEVDQLLDGRTIPLEGTRFFVARAGRLMSGDGSRVFADDDLERPVEGLEADELRAAFAGFEALLEGTAVETLESDEVRAALRALGYGE